MRELLCLVLFTVPFPVVSAAQSPEDDAAIRRLIQLHEVASRDGDLSGLVMPYHAQAEVATSTGGILTGREAIRAAYEQSLGTVAARSGRHHIHPSESVRIRFLSPDAALVEVESHSVGGADPDGNQIQTSRSLLITVWTKTNQGWELWYQRGVPLSEGR